MADLVFILGKVTGEIVLFDVFARKGILDRALVDDVIPTRHSRQEGPRVIDIELVPVETVTPPVPGLGFVAKRLENLGSHCVVERTKILLPWHDLLSR